MAVRRRIGPRDLGDIGPLTRRQPNLAPPTDHSPEIERLYGLGVVR